MRELSEHLKDMDGAVRANPARLEARDANLESARKLAAALPLVHRTGDGPDAWGVILKDRILKLSDKLTIEEAACGETHAVYFFLGAGAYPHGKVAILLDPRVLIGLDAATLSPFDSGGVCKDFCEHASQKLDSSDAKSALLAKYTAPAKCMAEYGAHYLAAHFSEPVRYVTAPQTSLPDFSPHHGVTSKVGDRRAWTVEVRLRPAVKLETRLVRGIVLAGGTRMLAKLDDDLLPIAYVPSEAALEEVDVAGAVAKRVLETLTGESAWTA